MNEPGFTQLPPAGSVDIAPNTSKHATLKALLDELAGYLRMAAIIRVETRLAPKRPRSRDRSTGHQQTPLVARDPVPVAWHVNVFPGGTIKILDGQDITEVGTALQRELIACVDPLIRDATKAMLEVAGREPLTMADYKAMDAYLDRRDILQRVVQLRVTGRIIRIDCQGAVFFSAESKASELQAKINAILNRYAAPAIKDVQKRIFDHVKDALADG